MTLIELLVVVVVIAVIACLLLPALMLARAKAQKITCNGNMKEIMLAAKIWAGDNTNLYPMSVSTNFGGTREFVGTGQAFRHFQVLSNELSTPKMLVCPADERIATMDFGKIFGNTNISYFVGVDASDYNPQTILSGDDNFQLGNVAVQSGLLNVPTNVPLAWTAARHRFSGNIGFADGSAQQTTSSSLQSALMATGFATNRLEIP